MSKTVVSLKELPKLFISSGMTLPELCEYLCVSEETIQEWERFFNLFPEKRNDQEKIYSKKRIQDFIKIKDSLDRGTPLHEIKKKIFKIKTEAVTNPFKDKERFVDFNFNKEELIAPPNQESIINPFLTQIAKANERIGELILEKARIVENAAIEKANLMSELKTLHAKNTELLSEKENLFKIIKEKEEQLKNSTAQEATLAEALTFSNNLLKQKEEDLAHLNERIEGYETALQEKNNIIYSQSEEINKLLEKQNKKWWHFLRDIFF